MRDRFLFVIWPYAASALFVGGLLLRLVLARRRIAGDVPPSAEARSVMGGRRLWLFCIVGLLGAHLLGLLFPQSVLAWNRVPWRLYLLEGSLLILGITAFAGCTRAVRRHFRERRFAFATDIADTALLALLLIGIASGLLTACIHRWGSSWGVTLLTPYIQSLFRGRPTEWLVTLTPFLVRLHLVSTLGCLTVFPFTHFAILLAAAINRRLHVLLRPISVRIHAHRTAAANWMAQHHPALWIWPEEDD